MRPDALARRVLRMRGLVTCNSLCIALVFVLVVLLIADRAWLHFTRPPPA